MKLHNKIAGFFGYELIKRRKHPSPASHVINLIRRQRIDVVLDVGANSGQFGAMLRDWGYRGDIHSFEPVAETFAALRQSAAGDSAWHTHNLALGDVPGEQVINVSASSDLSSFLAANAFGEDKYADIAVSATQAVAVARLDEFLSARPELFAARNIFLKMDTQGYDLNVLRGAETVLDRIDVLLSELSLIPIYTDMPDYLEALRLYRNYGFVLTGLYPISRRDDFSVIEMDCMFIRATTASHEPY
ncbi:MAG: FkbM family methyltransferase [Porticoccaceae bacterium]